MLNLQTTVRRWLAERFYQAKFGQKSTVVNRNEDLAQKTDLELRETLKGLLSQARELGVDIPLTH